MKKALVVIATVLVTLGVSSPAMAHNHLFVPAGTCNNSQMGVSPGNSGETILNPGGHPVGQAGAALVSQGSDHCVK